MIDREKMNVGGARKREREQRANISGRWCCGWDGWSAPAFHVGIYRPTPRAGGGSDSDGGGGDDDGASTALETFVQCIDGLRTLDTKYS